MVFKKPSKKAVVSLMSAGMMLAPTAISFVPQQVQAAENQYATQDISGFIEQIGWSAQDVAANNDLYASVMIAQAILESGYGSSALSNAPYYNLFGVKGSYNGQSVYMPTQEYLNGQWVEMNEPFRQYNSYWESFQDHANVLRSTSFATGTAHYSGVWKSQTTSFYDATNYLTGRYATDPGYAQKLNWLIETYQLTRFDTGTTQSTAWSNTTSTTTSETTTTTYSGSTSSAQSYQVASGDTLWDIANRFGTTVDALMASNGLSSEIIVIGQELIV
ncbi:glucosaminidase domain-containing protein [Enterococcus sp. OL5]|uniref:glucosaminidase domain-containing protein n=1 Tax=Enterococcus sp. OL5 TaxID=2590214 RepID=UPI00112963C9|nr:glucosaminidase domain-containing protein [Enterococcus sp. OL5]TPR57568.1 LysM peptidoglycan-binding domain-containing protein [Enterococcus sp. OL5]